jgi:hypothetical protein
MHPATQHPQHAPRIGPASGLAQDSAAQDDDCVNTNDDSFLHPGRN